MQTEVKLRVPAVGRRLLVGKPLKFLLSCFVLDPPLRL